MDHQIFRFTKIILRIRCSTSYDLGLLFRGRHSTLNRWNANNYKPHWYETVSSALNFPFLKEILQTYFILIFLPLKNKEISQNYFVFILINFENFGNFVDLFYF